MNYLFKKSGQNWGKEDMQTDRIASVKVQRPREERGGWAANWCS